MADTEMAGKDPIEVIKFCNDQGFRAIFDNGLMKKEPALQEKISAELERHQMDIGPFVLRAIEGGKSMVYDDPVSREKWKQGLMESIETTALGAACLAGAGICLCIPF